jgi:phage terminase large subunit-like protein
MKASTKTIRFLETLAIPEGPKAGELIKLAPFQKQFVKGALADDVNVAVLSIGRGNAKSALSANGSVTWCKFAGAISRAGLMTSLRAKRTSLCGYP